MRILLICGIILAGCSACAGLAPSPVTGEYRTSYSLGAIRVDLPDEERIPDRYDGSINRILESDDGLASDQEAAFRAYAEARGGLTEDNSGELFLEYMIQSQLERQLPGFYVGDREATLNVEIVSTVFPNTATMLLVGEVIGIGYEFSLTDTDQDAAMVESVEPMRPFVQPSAGAGGGLLGIALRGGGDRHLMDLQRMATALSNQAIAILGGQQINPGDVKRIAVYAMPDMPDESGAADHGDVVAP
jgi:hypothetical protein